MCLNHSFSLSIYIDVRNTRIEIHIYTIGSAPFLGCFKPQAHWY